MNTLNPDAQGQVFLQSPVQESSAIGALAGLAQGFIGQLPGPPSVAAQDSKDKKVFYTRMREAQALSAEGRTDAASAMMDKTFLDYTQTHGMGDKEITDFYTNASGKSALQTTTGSTFNLAQIMDTPEYQTNLALVQFEHPDMDSGDQVNEAFNVTIRDQATQGKIARHQQSKKLNWLEAEEDYIDAAKGVKRKLQALVANADEDDIITVDETREIRDFYKQITQDITKPAGVDDEDWDSYVENYVKPLDVVFTASMGALESDAEWLTGATKRQLHGILAKAVTQNKIHPHVLVAMTESNGDIGTVMELLKQSNGAFDNAVSLLEMTYDQQMAFVTEFEHQTNIDDLAVSVNLQNGKSFESLTGTVMKDSIESDIRMVTTLSDPGKRTIMMRNLLQKLDSMGGKTVTPKLFGDIFNPTFFKALKSIDEANPVIGEQLTHLALNSIKDHRSRIGKELNAQITEAGLSASNGKLVATDEDKMEALLKGIYTSPGEGFRPEALARFDGSWVRMFNESTDPSIVAKRREVVGELQYSVDRMKAATGAFNRLVEENLPQYGPAFQEVVAKPTTTQGTSSTSPEATALIGLVDKTEGGGNYSTLFGHSQKSGGKFSGVDVTKMTVSEALAFARQRGAGSYAQWVKDNNPKGDLASPMGRFQIVGGTLETLIEEMGLDGNELFDENMQNAMFVTLAERRMSQAEAKGGTKAAYLSAFRSEWDGFRHVNDEQLWAAVQAFKSGDPGAFITGDFATGTGGGGLPSGRDLAKPDTIDVQPLDGPLQAAQGPSGGGGSLTPSGGVSEGGGASGSFAEGSDGKPTASETTTQELTQRTKDMLKRNNIDPDVVIQFASEEEYREALRLGNVSDGDYVAIGQEVFQV